MKTLTIKVVFILFQNENIILDNENIENKDVFILLQNENIILDNKNIEIKVVFILPQCKIFLGKLTATGEYLIFNFKIVLLIRNLILYNSVVVLAHWF
ncbi:hypothetical protein [Cellulophaga sp. BC115SP]|uniref:hypothetical protein n=1 Tax=Cellulophaga sp. BC115SP TaxID=2683263 RepID=UPI00141221DD|nr:hypothetical protein [Cellulophaga sp. BC115SP]NBB31440.1 hypothetical protein [Cellulophaga sp. BC115SP]